MTSELGPKEEDTSDFHCIIRHHLWSHLLRKTFSIFYHLQKKCKKEVNGTLREYNPTDRFLGCNNRWEFHPLKIGCLTTISTKVVQHEPSGPSLLHIRCG